MDPSINHFVYIDNVSHADRLGYDDIEPEDELRSDFPCPYCYEDHDFTSLCSHLEDEHPFESKVVVRSISSYWIMCFFHLTFPNCFQGNVS
jgi:hypothetical protein